MKNVVGRMIVSVASGKGGTGKTTVAVSLALSLNLKVQLLDCDVEGPNDQIFFQAKNFSEKVVYQMVPEVDEKVCEYCGKCAQFCKFNAIAVVPKKVIIFPEICHGCGGCTLLCPKKALSERERPIGVVRRASIGNVELVYGELNAGEPLPVPVVREVKRHQCKDRVAIIDAPPGTSCPVIHSIYGSDYCILVTEPTPFGLHDLRLMVDVVRALGIPFGVIVNKGGFGDRKVYEYCEKEGIRILLEIPFDKKIAEFYSKGVALVGGFPEWQKHFQALFERIKKVV